MNSKNARINRAKTVYSALSAGAIIPHGRQLVCPSCGNKNLRTIGLLDRGQFRKDYWEGDRYTGNFSCYRKDGSTERIGGRKFAGTCAAVFDYALVRAEKEMTARMPQAKGEK